MKQRCVATVAQPAPVDARQPAVIDMPADRCRG
jgi:hypothetical protein